MKLLRTSHSLGFSPLSSSRRFLKTRTARLAFATMLARLLIVPSIGWGSVGQEGASFLDIPVGARPAALGGGYSALAHDAYAPNWNPGGLGFVNATEMAGQHLSYLESIHYEHLSIVHPFASQRDGTRRAIGASLQYLGSGDIPGTDVLGNSIGDFSAHYAAYTVSYGQSFTDRWSAGVSLKWLNAKIADVSANTIAADLGTLLRWSERLALAATLTQLGSGLKFEQDGDPLPTALHLGAAYQPVPTWLLNGEFEYRRSGLPVWHMGTEWSPVPMAALRVGYRTDSLKGLSALAGLTVGMGLKAFGHEFSYAWLPYGDLGSAQYFSLVLRFGAGAERKRNLIQFKNLQRHQDVKDPTSDEYQQLIELLDDKPKEPVVQAPTKPN